jgi:hypothetical protein
MQYPTIAFVVASLFSSCSSYTSDLSIPVRQTFALGGDQPGAFRVAAKNKGAVAVAVAERSAKGLVTERGHLAPDSSDTLDFSAGSTALIRNTGNDPARLILKITGDVPKGMGYEKGR